MMSLALPRLHLLVHVGQIPLAFRLLKKSFVLKALALAQLHDTLLQPHRCGLARDLCQPRHRSIFAP